MATDLGRKIKLLNFLLNQYQINKLCQLKKLNETYNFPKLFNFLSWHTLQSRFYPTFAPKFTQDEQEATTTELSTTTEAVAVEDLEKELLQILENLSKSYQDKT